MINKYIFVDFLYIFDNIEVLLLSKGGKNLKNATKYTVLV